MAQPDGTATPTYLEPADQIHDPPVVLSTVSKTTSWMRIHMNDDGQKSISDLNWEAVKIKTDEPSTIRLRGLNPEPLVRSGRRSTSRSRCGTDLMHRAFLKSGSARVVVTIRPGFEEAFLSVVETGSVGAPHDYLTIAQEMEAYAKTNYPGIRSANPIEDTRPLLSPLQRKAWEEMQGIMALLDDYQRNHNGVYPTTEQGLAELPAGAVPTEDPWGNPYMYASPGVTNDYDLASYGADDAEGGEGEAADITSWADANLIGRWYEYTPTSALDITFDETTPDETAPAP